MSIISAQMQNADISDYQISGITVTGTANNFDQVGMSTSKQPVSTSNCIFDWPYYQPTYTQPTYTYVTAAPAIYDIQLRKVEGGYIMLKGGKEYVITDPAQIVKYMTETDT